MRKKILTLLLIGLCASFVVLSSVVIYFRSAMQDDLFRLGEEFGEKTSEYVWTQARKQTMEAVERLTVARAAQMDSEMEEMSRLSCSAKKFFIIGAASLTKKLPLQPILKTC